MTTIQDRNPEQGVPAWLVNRVGKLVEARSPIDEYPAGRRGVLLSIASKSRWGEPGVYCTVAFNMQDQSDESNAELSQLCPVNLHRLRG